MEKQKYVTSKRKRVHSKEYHENNKEKINEYHKKYYKENKKEHRERTKKYEYLNRDKNNKYHREYSNKKFKTDLNFKLKCILRSRLWKALNGNPKASTTLKLLGCLIGEFKSYVEEQFLPEMNWENIGIVWELDHKRACSKFDLTNLEQQKQCFHYMNFEPIFKTTKIAESFGYIDKIGNRNKYNK